MPRTKINTSKPETYGIFLLALCFLFVLPISVVGGERGGSPIDIIPSDLLAAGITFIYFLFAAKYSRRENLLQTQIIFIFYCFVLASITVIKTNNLVAIFSFLKFGKMFMAFLAGYALAYWNGRDIVLRALSDAAAIYILLLAVSQFLYHADFTPRLGSEFFEFSVYGFPNSPSSYLVFLLCVSLIKVRRSNAKWILITVATLFAAGSLSRNALLLATIAVIFFFIDSPKKLISSVGTVAFGIGIFVLFDLGSLIGVDRVLHGIEQRLVSAGQSGDFSNGRLSIFMETFDLLSIKPVFGYKFQSFSDFAYHGTPHNQYLEVLFKTGIIGFIIYLCILFMGIGRIVRVRNNLPEDLKVKGIYLLLFLLLLSNLAQPNLSYSATGNLVFFIFGVFAIVPVRQSTTGLSDIHHFGEPSLNG